MRDALAKFFASQKLPRLCGRHWRLFFILLLGASGIFFRLTRPDIINDDAHIAVRSLFYFDYMFSQNQTTPIQWFGYVPWWSKLSFHDHPPLVFLIQHLFFKFFGVTNVIAKLPAALAGVATLFVFYAVGKTWCSRRAALLATFFLGINSYFIWIARLGYLEIFVIFFTLLSLYFAGTIRNRPHALLWSAFFFGLAFLSKYTAIYIAPVILATLLIERKEYTLRLRTILISLGLLTLCAAPLIFYNVMMYRTRGHFDVQFARFFQQNLGDWPGLADSVSQNYFGQLLSLPRLLSDALSPAVFILFIGALILLVILAWKKQIPLRGVSMLLISCASLTLLLCLIGTPARYPALYAPFIALALGAATDWLIRISKVMYTHSQQNRRNIVYASALLVGLMLLAYQIFYTFQTNHAYHPRGKEGIAYASLRIGNLGFAELDLFLETFLKGTKAEPYGLIANYEKVPWLVQRNNELMSDPTLTVFPSLILFDRNIDWFGRVWVMEKLFFNNGYLFYSLDDVIEKLNTDSEYFSRTGVASEAFLILPSDKNRPALLPSDSYYSQRANLVKQQLLKTRTLPLAVIHNAAGEPAFEFYKLSNYETLINEIN